MQLKGLNEPLSAEQFQMQCWACNIEIGVCTSRLLLINYSSNLYLFHLMLQSNNSHKGFNEYYMYM